MKKIIISFLTLHLFTCFVYAQAEATIVLSPKNPSPRSVVSLTLESYSFNVNTARITWQIGGKTVLEGRGETTLSLRTGEVGESIAVIVISETADGSRLEQGITVTPSSVTLLHEAPRSYVPLLYPGRSLAATGGTVRVSALPFISDSGVSVSPSSLSYSWYINDVFIKSASGIAKQSASFQLDYLKDASTVKVLIHTPLGNTGENTITIYPHEVMPVLYTFDSILGPDFNKAVEKRFETVKEFTFSLEPYYVSEEKTPSFDWFLDGLPSTPIGGRLLSFQPRENSYGSKILTVDVFGSSKRLQKASIKTELIFDTRK